MLKRGAEDRQWGSDGCTRTTLPGPLTHHQTASLGATGPHQFELLAGFETADLALCEEALARTRTRVVTSAVGTDNIGPGNRGEQAADQHLNETRQSGSVTNLPAALMFSSTVRDPHALMGKARTVGPSQAGGVRILL